MVIAGRASALLHCEPTITSLFIALLQMELNLGSISRKRPHFLVSVPRHSDLPPRLGRSSQSIRLRRDRGSSVALRSRARQPKCSPIALAKLRSTPQDLIAINKIYSPQQHRKMGVLMSD